MPPEETLDSVSELAEILNSGAVLLGMEGLKISYSETPVASLFVEGYELPLEAKDLDLAKFISVVKVFAQAD